MSYLDEKHCFKFFFCSAPRFCAREDSPFYLSEHGNYKFYLPMPRKMEVIGYVEGTLYPCDQLILMICGDGKLYSYDGDELHEVASSLQHLREVGIDYPASKSFYYGEAFKDMVSHWLRRCGCLWSISLMRGHLTFGVVWYA
uniref:Uncharacterized protein n=1 Tax=Kryptolebias marmoratus TaxID=37003 RepID=A0A3Q3BRZ2_KRYMA